MAIRRNESIRPSVRLILIGAVLVAGCHRVNPVDEISVDSQEPFPDAAPIEVGPDDWPGWRGPSNNGVAAPQSIPTSWSDSDHVVWKTAVPGRGHSSPTVVGDRIFLATADPQNQTQSIVAFDRQSGTQLWATEVHRGGFPSDGQIHGKSTHANCTVACDGHSVFVAFLNGDAIHATAVTVDGDVAWQTKLGPFDSKFGYAPSPVIHGSLVIFAADNRGGGYLAALHRVIGQFLWRKQRPAVSTYSSPVVANVAGRDQLLISGADVVASHDPLTGEPLWTCPGTTEATCGTIVWDDSRVFASGGYPGRQTICVDASNGREVWDAKPKCYEQSMLVHDDHLYALTDDGIAICWSAVDGTEKWKHRLTGPVSASPVLVNGNMIVSNETGTTYVIEASPDQFRLVAENRLGDESFASPAVCGNRLYLRVAERNGSDRQEFLYCIGNATADTER